MLEALKQESYEANVRLAEERLIRLNFGNASVIDRARGILAIKPSGVAYESLSASDMVLVDLDGNIVEGDLKPSSDTPTHVRLYQGFAEIGAVCHTHSTYATSFAQAGLAIPCYGTTHADFAAGEIPVTRAMTKPEIEGDYELETGNVILELYRDLDAAEAPMVLVHGHGPFAWGANGSKAADHAVALELIAELAFRTRALRADAAPIDRVLHDKHFKRKHGSTAYYGQDPQ